MRTYLRRLSRNEQGKKRGDGLDLENSQKGVWWGRGSERTGKYGRLGSNWTFQYWEEVLKGSKGGKRGKMVKENSSSPLSIILWKRIRDYNGG